jgi:hypothetical protein
MKNENHRAAPYTFLFVVRYTTCFGQIYWPSAGSHKQQCFSLELFFVNIIQLHGKCIIYNLDFVLSYIKCKLHTTVRVTFNLRYHFVSTINFLEKLQFPL